MSDSPATCCTRGDGRTGLSARVMYLMAFWTIIHTYFRLLLVFTCIALHPACLLPYSVNTSEILNTNQFFCAS
jgi:hypothetical protein